MNFTIRNLSIHLGGIALLGVCLAAGHRFGLHPVLVAQAHHQQAVADLDHLRQLLPTLEEQQVVLRRQIEVKEMLLQERYPIKTQTGQPLLSTVSALLSNRQITLSNLREENQQPNGELTLVFHASSKYQDMVRFVDDLRKLNCPARVTNLLLTPSDEQGEGCTAKITVRFSPVVQQPAA